MLYVTFNLVKKFKKPYKNKWLNLLNYLLLFIVARTLLHAADYCSSRELFKMEHLSVTILYRKGNPVLIPFL